MWTQVLALHWISFSLVALKQGHCNDIIQGKKHCTQRFQGGGSRFEANGGKMRDDDDVNVNVNECNVTSTVEWLFDGMESLDCWSTGQAINPAPGA